MTVTYKFISETQIKQESNRVQNVPVSNFTYADDALKFKYGFKPLISSEQPDPQDGKHAEPRYTDGENAITQTWVLVDNPPAPEPQPRVLSKLAMKRYLNTLTREADGTTVTAWQEFRAALNALDAYEDFMLSVNLREDDAGFATLKPQLSALLTVYGIDYDTMADACIYVPDNEVI